MAATAVTAITAITRFVYLRRRSVQDAGGGFCGIGVEVGLGIALALFAEAEGVCHLGLYQRVIVDAVVLTCDIVVRRGHLGG